MRRGQSGITGETFVVGAVVESATGKPLASYLSEKIWVPWGMEQDASWWLESQNGMGFGGGSMGQGVPRKSAASSWSTDICGAPSRC